jgi:hypothetical protein
MKYALAVLITLFAVLPVLAQKGIDTQTSTIKLNGDKVTTRPNDATRAFSWGKDKTKVRARLANPYKLNSRRDSLVQSIVDTIRERGLVLDDVSSRMKDGIIITQPFVFAKGSVIAASEMTRYADLTSNDNVWTRGRYTLTIEVQSIDGVQNNVSVNAKVEGRSANGINSEWVNVASSGLAEDEFLAKLIEAVTGTSPDPVQDTDRP